VTVHMFAQANCQLAAGVAADVSPPASSGVLLVLRLPNGLSGASHRHRVGPADAAPYCRMASPSPADSDVLAWRVLLWWFADQVIATLPPLGDEVCYLVVDSTLKDKTGQKHPLAKKGRLNEYAPDIFGLHIVVVMLQWGNYRIPIDFEMVRRKGHPHYRSESRLLRWMLVRLQRPSWAEMVIVVADAAFASKANIELI
jgi:hypothetical protein